MAWLIFLSSGMVHAVTIPVATEVELIAAVGTAVDGDVIEVTQSMTITQSIRVIEKNITIKGASPGITLTRASGAAFADGWSGQGATINPAMFEAAVSPPNLSTKSVTLTFKDIVLDDDNQVRSATITARQDAIVASYAPLGKVIIGKGTTLKNFGGISAVFLTEGASAEVRADSMLVGGNLTSGTKGAIAFCGTGTLDFKGKWAYTSGVQPVAPDIIHIFHGGNNPAPKLNFSGEISGIATATGIVRNVSTGSTITLLAGSKIINNKVPSYAAVYNSMGATTAVFDVHGEVRDNVSESDNGAAFYINRATINIHEGAKITGNVVRGSANGGSGAGLYLNHGASGNMHGGVISGNRAEGLYSTVHGNADHGGGGVAIVRSSTFNMHGGVIEGNSATVGGGVYVTAKNVSETVGPHFNFMGGTIRDNTATAIGSNNVHYGNDIAVAPSGLRSVNINAGRFVQVGKDAIIGEGFVAVGSFSGSTISGFDKAVYPRDPGVAVSIGSASAPQETLLKNDAATHYGSYTPYTSFWFTEDAPGTSLKAGITYPITLQPDPNAYLYLVAIQALNDAGDALAASPVTYVVPVRSATGLEISFPSVSGAEAYALLVLAEEKTGFLDLDVTYEGHGQFSETGTGQTSIVITGGTVSLTALPESGWQLQTVTLTAGDGMVTTKTATAGEIIINYGELAPGNNTVHAVFVQNTVGATVAIPLLTSWGLVALLLGLGAVGMLRRRG